MCVFYARSTSHSEAVDVDWLTRQATGKGTTSSIACSRDRGTESRGSARRSSSKGRERPSINQTNWNCFQSELLRDGIEAPVNFPEPVDINLNCSACWGVGNWGFVGGWVGEVEGGLIQGEDAEPTSQQAKREVP